jgi:hypothetical protein
MGRARYCHDLLRKKAVLVTALASVSMSISSTGSGGWIVSAMAASQSSLGGVFGALTSGNDGSIGSFLGQASGYANTFANISQNTVSSSTNFYAQIAAQNQAMQQQQQLQQALTDLANQQAMVQPQNTLDPFIYFANGSSLDTTNNILTMSDGSQIDTTTGLPYVNPANIVDLGGGSYLNSSTNVITLADGTKIDAVTGLKVT